LAEAVVSSPGAPLYDLKQLIQTTRQQPGTAAIAGYLRPAALFRVFLAALLGAAAMTACLQEASDAGRSQDGDISPITVQAGDDAAPRLTAALEALADMDISPYGAPVIGPQFGAPGGPDGSFLVLSTWPGHGTVSVDDASTITYTADSTYDGADSFGYTVTYGDGYAFLTTVRVVVPQDDKGE
jgi:hypothetical protein